MICIARALRVFFGIAWTVSLAGCSPVGAAGVVGEVVWSPEALMDQIKRRQPADGIVVSGSDGSRFLIPQVEGTKLSHLRTNEQLKIWSFYLLKDSFEEEFVRVNQPLSLGVAVSVEFGDLKTEPPKMPASALDIAMGEIHIENAECKPSDLPLIEVSRGHGSHLGTVEPLQIWRQDENSTEQMSCSRTTLSNHNNFTLVCNGSQVADFGVILYSFVTETINECELIQNKFVQFNQDIAKIVSISRVEK